MPLPISNNLQIVKDQLGEPYDITDGRWFTQYNQRILLAADTIATCIVPSLLTSNQSSTVTYILAQFTYRFTAASTAEGAEPDVWVSPLATPAITLPIAAVNPITAVDPSELNPTIRPVNIGQTLQFITSQAGAVVCISYFYPQL